MKQLITIIVFFYSFYNSNSQNFFSLSDTVFYKGIINEFEVNLNKDIDCDDIFLDSSGGTIEGIFPHYSIESCSIGKATIYLAVSRECYSSIFGYEPKLGNSISMPIIDSIEVVMKNIDDIYFSVLKYPPALNYQGRFVLGYDRLYIKSNIMNKKSISGEILSFNVYAYINDTLQYKIHNIGSYFNQEYKYQFWEKYGNRYNSNNDYIIFKDFIISINGCLYNIDYELKLGISRHHN